MWTYCIRVITGMRTAGSDLNIHFNLGLISYTSSLCNKTVLLVHNTPTFHNVPSVKATVDILKHMTQRNFCSHFRAISWACFLLQLSHLIWWYLAVSSVGSGPSTLCHRYWCCSDFHKAMMRSHSLKRNIFHWAKSEKDEPVDLRALGHVILVLVHILGLAFI